MLEREAPQIDRQADACVNLSHPRQEVHDHSGFRPGTEQEEEGPEPGAKAGEPARGARLRDSLPRPGKRLTPWP